MWYTLYSFQIVMKLEFSQQIFEKSLNVTFHENPYSRSRVVPCGKTEGRTDMKKLIVAFRYFVNAPKTHFMCSYPWHLGIIMLTIMVIQFNSVPFSSSLLAHHSLDRLERQHRKSERIFPIINHKLQHIAQRL
jgi:hypothetical protein